MTKLRRQSRCLEMHIESIEDSVWDILYTTICTSKWHKVNFDIRSITQDHIWLNVGRPIKRAILFGEDNYAR